MEEYIKTFIIFTLMTSTLHPLWKCKIGGICILALRNQEKVREVKVVHQNYGILFNS